MGILIEGNATVHQTAPAQNASTTSKPNMAYARSLAAANGHPLSPARPPSDRSGLHQSATHQNTTQIPNQPGLPPFKSIEQALLPLSGQQIHDFRQTVRKTQDAGNEPVTPIHGITRVITVNPNDGLTPKIVMAAGYACSITVVDGAGQPWPIMTATIGDGTRFKIEPINKGAAMEPTVVVSDLLPHAQSNLLLTLQGMNTPIPVQLVSGGPIDKDRETVDYRVILRVRGMAPGSLPATFSPSPNRGTTAALLQTLYGTMPEAAKTLKVQGAPAYSVTRAWLLNGDLWIRTHARLLAPSWIATEQSANGVHAYVLSPTHALLLRFDGINTTVEVHHD